MRERADGRLAVVQCARGWVGGRGVGLNLGDQKRSKSGIREAVVAAGAQGPLISTAVLPGESSLGQ